MGIPSNAEILLILDNLEYQVADDLETEYLDFKPWTDSRHAMKEAIEYGVCFANGNGGVIVFGVADDVRGRENAIRGIGGYNIDTWKRGIYDNIRPHIEAIQIEELLVPEGTGRILVVRIPKGQKPPYGTSQGLFKRRVGKNCMPMDATEFASMNVSSGAIDWSGQPANNVILSDLDPLEIARARSFIRRANPESELLRLDDIALLRGLEAVRDDSVTNTGLLLFGRPDIVAGVCPQSQVHYVHQIDETNTTRNDLWKTGLLQTVEKLESIFSSPVNPEEEIPMGLLRLRIPAFPIEVVREAVLNAVTHRNYSDPGEVLIRHTPRELVVTSPGGFIGGINLSNILRHEPVARNRTLSNAFLKLRLVESAGTGRRKIFVPMLQYGKRIPKYEANSSHVTLRIFDGTLDYKMARLVAKWQSKGKDIDFDGLLVLTYLKEHRFINSQEAETLLQLDRDHTLAVLDQMCDPKRGILERRGHSRPATYYLTKAVAKDLIGKAGYSSTKGINPVRYPELVKVFLQDHEVITNKDCRELLGLGDSASAQVEASRYLKRWSSSPDAFLIPDGKPPKRKYYLKKS